MPWPARAGAAVLARLQGVETTSAMPSLRVRFRYRDYQLQELAKAFQTARWGRTVEVGSLVGRCQINRLEMGGRDGWRSV